MENEGRLGDGGYGAFLEENAYWLEGYALFEAVRAAQGGRGVADWPDEIRNPSARVLAGLRGRFAEGMERARRGQHRFFSEWRELKAYANLRGVGIIGDLPIYTPEDSADFWLRRELFDVGGDGRPASSAGVPPDAFSAGGQVWDMPVYAWEKRRGKILAFWKERLAQAARLYDGVRIDHFRAFADYWAAPLMNGELKIENGKLKGEGQGQGEWRLGPGAAFTDMVRREFPGLFVIAEDLGELSEAAARLIAKSGFPGMKVIQFAFSGGAGNPYLPHNIGENSVAYTGTHDNNTLLGWTRSAPNGERTCAMKYLGITRKEDLPAALLAATLASKADTAIIPLQDWLGLGAAARTNTPGTAGGRNWKWRCEKKALTRRLAERMRGMTEGQYGR